MENPKEMFARIRAKAEKSKEHYPAMKEVLDQLASVWVKKMPKNNEDKNTKRKRFAWILDPRSEGLKLLLWFGTSHYLHEILGYDTSLRRYFYEEDVKDTLVRIILTTNSLERTQFLLSIDDDEGVFFKPQRTDIDIEDVESLQSVVNRMIEKISGDDITG